MKIYFTKGLEDCQLNEIKVYVSSVSGLFNLAVITEFRVVPIKE